VRYRYFDQPLFERARQQEYDQIEEHLGYLASNPEAADRYERVRALIECPQPLFNLISGRFATADQALRKLMLEALTRRYYRIRELTNFRSVNVDGQCCTLAEYEHEGKHIHLFTTHAGYSRLAEAARTLFPMIAEVPADHDIVIDFYVFHSGKLGDPDSTQQEVRSVLDQVGFPRSIRRIVVTAAGTGQHQGIVGMHFHLPPHPREYV
jgi:hypothetical protein